MRRLAGRRARMKPDASARRPPCRLRVARRRRYAVP
ncbi:hypothetical protein BURPSPAST_Z0254 [Burkholderia pseudomallei Pasteur 52237]|uniref:Uncharacterized protein n=1 Tax=Burkholderia pseudomallei (strain 1710b) TaxID=320372 RepID=Q3JVX8_BURP1|nr:hypothetical protein BURPS1710b_0862 [Burkholderia pseudomallei 1710b]EDO91043.1 hypothetical protein BURPSPAST_Z0254 [Burkholderia pseudomallei Pasteur 52237]EDU09346.1 hypothetical protein BURPS1655_K0686 [Burkholderia pseudomallei 1655]